MENLDAASELRARALLHSAYVGGIAHAIRLGKCPQAGVIMGFSISLDEISEDGTVTAEGPKIPVEFEVTEELIQEACRMIAGNNIETYDKTSVVSLTAEAVPERLWDAAAKLN